MRILGLVPPIHTSGPARWIRALIRYASLFGSGGASADLETCRSRAGACDDPAAETCAEGVFFYFFN